MQVSVYQGVGFILVILMAVLQLVPLLGLFSPLPDWKVLYASMEMLLLLFLLINAWRIWRVLAGHCSSSTGDEALILNVARLCFLSLALCVLGDLINRNYFDLYYQHGSNIEHSYLADSVWFFFPGYACFIVAAYRVGRQRSLSRVFMFGTGLVFSVLGLLSFVTMYQDGAGTYVATLTGTYAALIAVMCAAALWLIKACGWAAMKWIAIGAVLASVADALIGNFWIYREGFYPAIAHINMMIYFASQALLQQLPLQLWMFRETSE